MKNKIINLNNYLGYDEVTENDKISESDKVLEKVKEELFIFLDVLEEKVTKKKVLTKAFYHNYKSHLTCFVHSYYHGHIVPFERGDFYEQDKRSYEYLSRELSDEISSLFKLYKLKEEQFIADIQKSNSINALNIIKDYSEELYVRISNSKRIEEAYHFCDGIARDYLRYIEKRSSFLYKKYLENQSSVLQRPTKDDLSVHTLSEHILTSYFEIEELCTELKMDLLEELKLYGIPELEIKRAMVSFSFCAAHEHTLKHFLEERLNNLTKKTI